MKGTNMAINFWISIPIDIFFDYSSDIMQKHGVAAYLETKSTKNGITDTTYIPYRAEHTVAFIKYFLEPAYYGFYFTAYPFSDIREITKFPGRFYNEQISPYTIEGRGGPETERTREQIQLRQIQKSPDKSILSFYSALQRNLKSIPALQKKEKGMVNLYYLRTTKIIIPPHPHSNKVQGSWEEYYLNHVMKKEQK